MTSTGWFSFSLGLIGIHTLQTLHNGFAARGFSNFGQNQGLSVPRLTASISL